MIFWHPCGVRKSFGPRSGGLRFAATTGYYLPALQADEHCITLPRNLIDNNVVVAASLLKHFLKMLLIDRLV